MAEVDVDLHDEGTENGTVYQTAKTKFYQSIWRLDCYSLLFAQQIGCSSMSLDFFWDREEGEGCVCVCVWGGGGCSVFFRRSVHSRNSSSVKEQKKKERKKEKEKRKKKKMRTLSYLSVCLSCIQTLSPALILTQNLTLNSKLNSGNIELWEYVGHRLPGT